MHEYKEYRCVSCGKLLFRYKGGEIENCTVEIETKCPRCKNTANSKEFFRKNKTIVEKIMGVLNAK